MPYYPHRSAKGGFSLGGAIKGLGKIAVGAFTGGPAGAIAGGLSAVKDFTGKKVIQGAVSTAMTVPSKQSLIGGIAQYTPVGAAINWAVNKYGPGGGTVPMTNGQCPVGYHPNKQKSAKGEARTYCVRNRSMNPANGRAIGRAATRIRKGIKMYKRSLSIVGTSLKGKRVLPKRRK